MDGSEEGVLVAICVGSKVGTVAGLSVGEREGVVGNLVGDALSDGADVTGDSEGTADGLDVGKCEFAVAGVGGDVTVGKKEDGDEVGIDIVAHIAHVQLQLQSN
jgi:hypothetical protein